MVIESNEQTESGIKIYLNHPWNLIKSIFLIFTWIILVSSISLNGIVYLNQ